MCRACAKDPRNPLINPIQQPSIESHIRKAMHIRDILKSGHPGTLFTALIYFDFCFAVWVLNGAMAPFISNDFGLSDVEKGIMVSVPVIAGALMRFPLGLLSQYIGRKRAAQLEM